MKKLRQIIRESIKQLMTEQATGGCTNPVFTNLAVNVPNGASNQAVNYTPGQGGNLTWFVCGAQTTGMWASFVPSGGCCQAHGMIAQNAMNPVPNTAPNNDLYTAVINAQSMSPGSNSGVNGLYARFEDCVMNCPGAYSPSNPPPPFNPCGDACWENYHNFGVTTTPQSSGPTGVGIDRDAPERGEDTPTMTPTACDEFSRFTREEKSDICEECLTNPNSFPEFCECCDDSMINEMEHNTSSDDPGTDPCKDSNWINMPDGATAGNPGYSYFKNDYCDRCNAGNGVFPVVWNNPGVPPGGFFYDPFNGTDYCSCCKDHGTGTNTGSDDPGNTGEIPLEDLPCKDLIAMNPTFHNKCCMKDCKGKGLTANHPCVHHCKCCDSPKKSDDTKQAIREMYKAFSKLKK